MEPGAELSDKLEVECPLGSATAEDWAVPVTGEYQVWMGLLAEWGWSQSYAFPLTALRRQSETEARRGRSGALRSIAVGRCRCVLGRTLRYAAGFPVAL